MHGKLTNIRLQKPRLTPPKQHPKWPTVSCAECRCKRRRRWLSITARSTPLPMSLPRQAWGAAALEARTTTPPSPESPARSAAALSKTNPTSRSICSHTRVLNRSGNFCLRLQTISYLAYHNKCIIDSENNFFIHILYPLAGARSPDAAAGSPPNSACSSITNGRTP